MRGFSFFDVIFTVLSIWLSGHLLLFTAKYTNSLLAMFIVVCLLPFLFIIFKMSIYFGIGEVWFGKNLYSGRLMFQTAPTQPALLPAAP